MQLTIQPDDTPPRGWIERLVRSPLVRSGYLSLAGHLLLALLAAIVAWGPARPQRPRPLQLAFARPDTDAGLLEQVEVGGDPGHDPRPQDAPPLVGVTPVDPPLVPAADLVAIEPAVAPEAVAEPPVLPGDEGGTPAVTAVGPLAQPVSARRSGARTTARGGVSGGSPEGRPSPRAAVPPARPPSAAAAEAPRARLPSSAGSHGWRSTRRSTVRGGST